MEEMATLVVADGAMQGVKRCANTCFLPPPASQEKLTNRFVAS